MGRRRRSFTAEFKLEAVRLANESGKSPGEIARDLGIRPDILRHWRAQMERLGLQYRVRRWDTDAAAGGRSAVRRCTVQPLYRRGGGNPRATL